MGLVNCSLLTDITLQFVKSFSLNTTLKTTVTKQAYLRMKLSPGVWELREKLIQKELKKDGSNLCKWTKKLATLSGKLWSPCRRISIDLVQDFFFGGEVVIQTFF